MELGLKPSRDVGKTNYGHNQMEWILKKKKGYLFIVPQICKICVDDELGTVQGLMSHYLVITK